MASPPAKKWYHIRWYSDTDTKEERKFIRKIDALIVPYAVLAYWVKYIDQVRVDFCHRRNHTHRISLANIFTVQPE